MGCKAQGKFCPLQLNLYMSATWLKGTCCTLSVSMFSLSWLWSMAAIPLQAMYGHSCKYSHRGGCLLFMAGNVSWTVLSTSEGRAAGPAWSGAAMKPWVFPGCGGEATWPPPKPEMSPWLATICPGCCYSERSEWGSCKRLVWLGSGSPGSFAVSRRVLVAILNQTASLFIQNPC